MSEPVFRFAPSPNGYLHLGHALSALLNFDMARAAGGRFLLRLEDIDAARCRAQYEDAICEGLAWLRLRWEEPVRRQSAHFDAYRAALAKLDGLGMLYPSFESRGEITRMLRQRGEWPRDPDGAPLYPGHAHALSPAERRARMDAGEPYALRLDMAAAMTHAGSLTFTETGAGPDGESGTISAAPQVWGDVVLARKEIPASYHLCVVMDDATQGVTHIVTRPGSVLGDKRAPASTGAAGTPGAGLSPPSAPAGRGRPQALQINAVNIAACAACGWRHPCRYPPAGGACISVARMTAATCGFAHRAASPGYRFTHPGYKTDTLGTTV